MSRSLGAISFAAWVVTALALQLHYDSHESPADKQIEEQTRTSQANPEGAPDGAASGANANSAFSGSEHDQHSADQRSHTTDKHLYWGDGVAQWAMTAAAFITVGVSLWAVWLLKETLSATRAAAKSASDAVAATLQIGRTQSRAYLGQTQFLVTVVQDRREQDVLACFQVSVGNGGATPAFRCESRCIVRDMHCEGWPKTVIDTRLLRGEMIMPGHKREIIRGERPANRIMVALTRGDDLMFEVDCKVSFSVFDEDWAEELYFSADIFRPLGDQPNFRVVPVRGRAERKCNNND